MGFAYMQYGLNDMKFLDQMGMDVSQFYNRTFESDIRKCNERYRAVIYGNELMAKRTIGTEKIAVAREFILSTLYDYKPQLCSPELLRKQMMAACYIKGSDIYWVHACIEASQQYYNKNFKNN